MPSASGDPRLAGWVDLVGDLLLGPPTPFPVELVLCELGATFGVSASWHWADGDGRFGFVLHEAIPGWPDERQMEEWASGVFTEHPLIRWFSRTGDPTANTIDRVPRDVYSAEGLRLVRDHLAPYQLEQQLSMPYRLGDGGHRAFVLATSGRDFDDQALLLAQRIQPLLILLARQTAALDGDHPVPLAGQLPQADRSVEAAAQAGITGRQLAVLRLLERGLTAESIGRTLGISTRTVHVHLSNLYRTLSVHDRLMAVQMARSAGLLGAPEHLRTPAAPGPVPYPERAFAWRPDRGMVHETGRP
jgi:DNA-binding CsgD family transcriptional regulator